MSSAMPQKRTSQWIVLASSQARTETVKVRIRIEIQISNVSPILHNLKELSLVFAECYPWK